MICLFLRNFKVVFSGSNLVLFRFSVLNDEMPDSSKLVRSSSYVEVAINV